MKNNSKKLFVSLIFLTTLLAAETGGSVSIVHSSQTIYRNALRTSGYKISSPGYYTVGEDIPFNADASSVAITIECSSVTLDMNNRTLSQANTSTGVTAIKIEPNVHDITIKNGKLSGFTSYGLYHDVSSTDTGAYNVTVDHLDITGMPTGATSALRLQSNSSGGLDAHDWSFSDCVITDNSVTGTLCYLGYCNNISLYNCKINGNVATSRLLYGFNSGNIALGNCDLSSNNSPYIVSLVAGAGCNVQGCTILNNSAESLACIDLASSCTGCIITHCTINKNSATTTTAYGISLSGGAGNRVESCEISSLSATTTAYGIYGGSESTSSVNDSLLQNITGSTGSAYGIYVDAAVNNLQVKTCQVLSALSSAASGYGIYVDANAVKTSILETQVYSNSTYGINNDSATSLIYNCTAGSNGIVPSPVNFGGNYPAVTGGSTGNFSPGQYGCGLDYRDGKIYIYASAIEKASPAIPGLTISSPGSYVLAEDVDYSPSGSAVPAITIASSYVDFDMNNKTIYQNSSDATTNVDGIVINAGGLHDITIKDGTLAGFRRYGLANDASLTDTGAYNVTIKSLAVTGMPSGYSIFLRGGNGAGLDVHDWSFSNCIFSENNVTDLVFTSSSNNISMIDCKLNGNTCSAHLVNGATSGKIFLKNCYVGVNNSPYLLYLFQNLGSIIDGCVINNNRVAGNIYSIYVTSSNGCTVKNCSLSKNLASAGTSRGIVLINGTGNVADSCLVSSVEGTGALTGSMGIDVGDVGTVIRNCDVSYVYDNGATTGTVQTYGIYVFGNNNFVEDCEVTRVYSSNPTGTPVGYGIYLASTATNNLVYKCKSISNSHYGVYDAGTNDAVTGCVAAVNTTANYGGALAAGVSITRGGLTLTTTVYDDDNRNIG